MRTFGSIVACGALYLSGVAGGGRALFAQTAASVKETAYARVAFARAIAANPDVVADVAAKNGEKETMDEVHRKDKEWAEKRDHPLKRAQLASRCAERLRSLIKDDTLVVEAILMDERGANVCVSAETSDYWQGDEAKWQRIFLDGREVFVDEPAFDASSGAFAVQLSVPVARDGRRIGVLAVTIKIRKELVSSGS